MAAEIPDGAVIVARAILNSSLWTMRPEDRIVAMTCIALCNRKPRKWWDGTREITILAGQFVRSREGLQKACHMPLQRVRTSVLHLEKVGFLTRHTTRLYTVYTLPKYLHYQDLAKYSDSVILKDNPESNPQLTSDQPATNHKQQHIPPSVPIRKSSKKTDGGTSGGVVVVGDETSIRKLVNVRMSTELLTSIGMTPKPAHSLAAAKPVYQVLSAVQQARKQSNPGGWARLALDGDWILPAPEGPELVEVVAKLEAERKAKSDALLRSARKVGANSKITERLPGEDEGAWFRRVSDELKRRKEGARTGGPEKSRGQKENHRPPQEASSG